MSKIPKLRFKEFSGEWESKKLGELGDVTKLAGFEFTKHVEYADTGKIIALRGLNVKNGKLVLNDIKYIDNSDFSKLSRSKLFIDDLLFTYVGTVGETALIDENDKYYLAPNVSRIRFNLNKSNSKFMHYNMSRSEYFNKIIQPSIATSSQPALSMENIRKLNINIPLKEEQDKIASFFSLIDDKISLQSEKVEALKDYKKGMMQKIFSRELRFKDDEGRDYPEWEEKKLGECIENKGGTALEKFVDKNGTHKFISIGNYSTDGKYIDTGQRISLNEKTKDKLLYKGDLVMVLNDKTSTGDLIGSTILIDEDDTYIYNQRSERLICNENIHSNFAWIILNYEGFRKRVFSIAQGGTQIYVNFSSLKELKIELPRLKEQCKISKFILSIDAKLEREQEKLDSLNEYKKGLLQQMFV